MTNENFLGISSTFVELKSSRNGSLKLNFVHLPEKSEHRNGKSFDHFANSRYFIFVSLIIN